MADTQYLAHYGVKGMKWGVRKDKYDRKMLKKDRESLRKQGVSPIRASLVARSAQKRMAKKGEIHRVALRKAHAYSLIKEAAITTSAFVGMLALNHPKVRGAANRGAFIVGQKAGKAGASASRTANTIKKVMNKNIITVDPVDAKRGRDIVGLLTKR